MDKIMQKLNDVNNIIVIITYKCVEEDNITYYRITGITSDLNTKFEDPHNNIITFFNKNNVDKYYICRLWSYKLDKFISIDYICKLDFPTTHTLNPLYYDINKILKTKNITIDYNKHVCFDKVSKNPITINKFNDNGLYEPYEKDKLYYGLIDKNSLDHDEPIIMCIGKDKQKLIDINNENNNECYLNEIPNYYNSEQNNLQVYGYIHESKPESQTCLQGILSTNNYKSSNFISTNPIDEYVYYEEGIMNG
jgi:hypothetical protein